MSRVKCKFYATEFVADIALASRLVTWKPCSIIEFRDEAEAVGESSWSSIKSVKKVMTRVTMKNPAFVARRFSSNPSRIDHSFDVWSLRLDDLVGTVDPSNCYVKPGRAYRSP